MGKRDFLKYLGFQKERIWKAVFGTHGMGSKYNLFLSSLTKEGASQDQIPEDINKWVGEQMAEYSDVESEQISFYDGFEAAFKKLQEDLRQATIIHEKTAKAIQSQLSSIKAERDEAAKSLEMLHGRPFSMRVYLVMESQIKKLTEDLDFSECDCQAAEKDRDLYKRECESYKQAWIEATATLDWKNIEIARLREEVADYRKSLEQIRALVCITPLQEVAEIDDIVQNILGKYKKEE